MADDGTRRYFALLHFETATTEINVFVIVKTFSSFFNYASQERMRFSLRFSFSLVPVQRLSLLL